MKLIKFKEISEKLKTPSAVFQYRRNEILNIFKEVKQPVKVEDGLAIKQGLSESYFVSELELLLDFSVFTKQVLKFDHSEKGYYPDIVVKDKKSGLLIDIEIDEPYALETGDPIHCIDGDDLRRDLFFLENGWLVIRFCEEQIVRQTKACAEFIADVVKSFYDKMILSKEQVTPIILSRLSEQLIEQPKWTKESAHRLAYGRYRQDYLLTKDLLELTRKNISNSQ